MKKKSTDILNRICKVIGWGGVGTASMYIWIMIGTNFLNSMKHLTPVNLPSNITKAPYCCKKRSKTEGKWKYGFPYDLGDNSEFIPFPCKIKMISFKWLRTLFYITPWLSGTLKESWSMGRGILQKLYIPNTLHSGKWNIKEALYLLLGPTLIIPGILLSGIFGILLTYYGSFKTNKFWSLFGFFILFFLAAINGLVQMFEIIRLLLFKDFSLSPINHNFFKYGRGPFMIGILILILKIFPEIPLYMQLFLIISTITLLFVIK